jgi:hypothetical protein
MAKLSLRELEEILFATLTGMSVEVFEAKQRSGLSPPNIRAGSGSIPISLTSRCLKFCNTCAPMGRGPTSSRAAAKILCACTRSKSMASLLSRWSGTAGGTKYGYDKDGKPFLTKEPKLLLNDNDAGKPEGIHLMIGRPGRSTARRTRAACFRLREHGEDVLAREEKLDMLVQERTRALGDRTEQLEILSIKLSKYLPPQVYASIFQGRQKVEITSNRKKLTVFFSDIVGFTDTTENLESEELTGILNRYLNDMAAITVKHGATLDKYVGDAIIAFLATRKRKASPKTRGPAWRWPSR